MSTRSGCPTVAIVITTFNHAHFLGEAIASALAQTHPADEVIVIDDGSEDNPSSVASGFAGVRLLRQSNHGLSAARNAGLFAAQSEMIVFLDADDRLLPNAVKSGLACHRHFDMCALVYGGHQYITLAGNPLGGPKYSAISSNGHVDLLGGNLIGMHATVMYRREILVKAGGFDLRFHRCEDYDVYLRLAKQFRVASHRAIVAEYRKHGDNMSWDHLEMLRWVLTAQINGAPRPHSIEIGEAVRKGQSNWRAYYAEQILLDARSQRSAKDESGTLSRFCINLTALGRAWQASPRYVARLAMSVTLQSGKRALPSSFLAWLRRIHYGRPISGGVRFGDLARTAPIDSNFGFGRGVPIDRFYIESFLDANSNDIAGRVLEVGDDKYSRRFGAERVTRQDVLHLHGNAQATIVGDLSESGTLPPESFDCIVLTQTLHLIFDMRAAIAQLHAALRPGGVLMLTVPGISQIDRNDWGERWYWALTPASVLRLLLEVFDPGSITVESHGNVFAAVCFLHGLALEELPRAKLVVQDSAYPVIVTARARRLSLGETG